MSLKKAADAEFKRGVSYKVTAELRLVKGRKVVQASETFQVVGKNNDRVVTVSCFVRLVSLVAILATCWCLRRRNEAVVAACH